MSKQQIVNYKIVQNKGKNLNQVIQVTGNSFNVESGTSHKIYRVERTGGGWEAEKFTCTCDWGKYHSDSGCSHVVSVREFLANLNGKTISVWGEEDLERQHREKAVAGGDGTWITARKIESKTTATKKQQFAVALYQPSTVTVTKTGKFTVEILVKTTKDNSIVTCNFNGKVYQAITKTQRESVMDIINQLKTDGIEAILKVKNL